MNIPELYTRPAFSLVPHSSVKLQDSGKGLSQFIDQIHMAKAPALQAFAFYYLDHCVALIKSKYPDKVIPKELGEVVGLYHAMTSRFGMDMYAYLLLICNREFRYCKSPTSQMLEVLGNDPAAKFSTVIKGASSNAVYKDLVNYEGSATLGRYCEVMTNGYNKLSWGSCYGGKKWGDIAKVLENYVLGRIPLMTLLDQSFSLQHNTCAIFNKGTVYEKETSNLLPLLDLQHAGQMIAVAHDLFFGVHDGLNIRGLRDYKKFEKPLRDVLVIMSQHFEGLDVHVDWDAAIKGNPATGVAKLQAYKKDWYAAFGIYDGTHATTTPHGKTYYEISDNEKYETIKRTK